MNRGARPGSAVAVAERLGLSYVRRLGRDFISRFADLPEILSSATARHVMQGTVDERGLVIFESTHMVCTGYGFSPVRHTVYVTDAPDWPRTRIIGRHWLDRLSMRFGRPSGLMLEHPEFNKRFMVTTQNVDFAIALLSPEMQEFLLSKTNARWQVGGQRVSLIYAGSLKPARVRASLDRMRRFWQLVPPELEEW